MKIIVLIKSVLDTKIPLECVEETGRLKADWNVSMTNPDDATAVNVATGIKKHMPDAHVTVVHWGPQSGERLIRNSLALGCDEGLRIWDESFEELHTGGKVIVFARAATLLGFDLIFTGTKSLDTGSSQLGVLLACTLGIPCITRVSGINKIKEGAVAVTRRLERGYQEQVAAAGPLVVAIESDESGEEPTEYASFATVARAAERFIPCWSFSQIGIPPEGVRKAESRLKFGPLRLPEPRLQFIQPPDSSLPAFDRRRRLGEAFVQKRQGRIVQGDEDAVVEELFQSLLREGCLTHLKHE